MATMETWKNYMEHTEILLLKASLCVHILWVIVCGNQQKDWSGGQRNGVCEFRMNSVIGQSTQEFAPQWVRKHKKTRVTEGSEGQLLFHARFWDIRCWSGSSAICLSPLSEQWVDLKPNTLTFHFFCTFTMLYLFSYSRYDMDSVSAAHILELSWKNIKLIVIVTFRFVTYYLLPLLISHNTKSKLKSPLENLAISGKIALQSQ